MQTKRHNWIQRPAKAIVLGCFLIAVCHAESTTIRIRFVNGKSGKPLRLKWYEHGESALSGSKYKIEKVDGDSLIVTFNDVQNFGFRSAAFDPCDARTKHEAQPQYSLQEVVSRGLVSPNFCGHHTVQPKAGELVIYSRHQRWWEITANVARGLLICA